ncbi:MAG: hypothetical protein WC390_08995 [Sulfurimonas sp.]
MLSWAEFKGAYMTKALTLATATSTGIEGQYNSITFYNPSAAVSVDISTASVSEASNRFSIKAGTTFTVHTSTHVYMYATLGTDCTVYYLLER